MSNIGWLYRDYVATKDVIAAYSRGDNVTEPAFVDCSKLRGGVLEGCTLRYLIASSHAVDLGRLSADARRYGLIVFARGLTWRVLDKYKVGEITQILITPDTNFDDCRVEQYIIEAGRRDFDELYEAAPVAILNSDVWKKRLFFPIGLNSENIPYFH